MDKYCTVDCAILNNKISILFILLIDNDAYTPFLSVCSLGEIERDKTQLISVRNGRGWSYRSTGPGRKISVPLT